MTDSLSNGHSTRSVRAVRFEATPSRGDVSGLLQRPENASALLVLGHGAGAGMTHSFLEDLAGRLATGGVATLRYQFPYMEAATSSGKRRGPDPAPILQATVRSAVQLAHDIAPDLPLFAGGKSMGGRMTSQSEASEPLPGVHGLIFFGFPLHPSGKPGVERAAHLAGVQRPMLFLQGTRDSLAGLDLLVPITRTLKSVRLHVVDGGDHSFQMLKRSGKTRDQTLDELATTALRWTAEILA